jgi:hypothetical protein
MTSACGRSRQPVRFQPETIKKTVPLPCRFGRYHFFLNEFELSSWNIKRSVAHALRTFFGNFLERAQENHRAGVEDRCAVVSVALVRARYNLEHASMA